MITNGERQLLLKWIEQTRNNQVEKCLETKEALDLLTRALETDDRTMKALEWALTGRVGMSSKQLVATHFGFKAEVYHPLDAGDRGRCIAAMKFIGGLEPTLAQLEKTPGWCDAAPLIREEYGKVRSE